MKTVLFLLLIVSIGKIYLFIANLVIYLIKIISALIQEANAGGNSVVTYTYDTPGLPDVCPRGNFRFLGMNCECGILYVICRF